MYDLVKRLVLPMMVVAVLALQSGISSSSTTGNGKLNDPDGIGIDWVTIGEPGNMAFPGQWNSYIFKGRGSVGYHYRLSHTEITVIQYLEFIEAYLPFYEGDPSSSKYTGSFIRARWRGGRYRFEIIPGWEKAPTNMSIRIAARICNWLHNGKVNQKWAFESGVYDTSTFTQNMDRSYNDDYTRAPDARYWIPSVDEWLKAVYYDPERDEDDDYGHWWHFPNRTDEALVIGLPEHGGQTNASLMFEDDIPPLITGMYPNELTAWGLIDASGGMSEITVDWTLGSSMFEIPETVRSHDRAGGFSSPARFSPDKVFGWGLRMASAVPNEKEP